VLFRSLGSIAGVATIPKTPSKAASALGGALSGAAGGMMVAGPAGAVVGGILGAAMGLLR
jgi:hypothetical protein